jgi:alpha-1,6-mannosyltransferase
VAKNALFRPLAGLSWAYLRSVCARADVTIVAGDWLRGELANQGCERVRTVHFGIDREAFGPERRDEALRRELLGSLAGDPEARLVLIAGRLAADKRQRLVIDALELVAKDRPVGLVLLGDGPERERLEARGRRLPNFRGLRFTRDREEYARLLASVDALAHGSLCETFGFLLAECLASGTPLAAPDRGGAADLAAPGYAETYATFGGPEAAARAIQAVLSRPRSELSRLARSRAESIPTTREHYAALFRTYDTLLRGL